MPNLSIKIPINGHLIRVWIMPKGKCDEALDCRVYAFASYHILNDKDTPINQGNIDLICKVLPCQPFSIAGRKNKKSNGRLECFLASTLPEMFRIISVETCLDCVRKCCSLHAHGIHPYEN